MPKLTIKLSRLFFVFLMFLPFTQALTLKIGFPLKISELILGFIILVFIAKLSYTKKIESLSAVNFVLILFLVWATCSFFINTFWKYNYELKEVPNRINPFFDSLLRLIYIYISIIAFFITQYFLRKNIAQSLRYWVIGAIAASAYSWYLFLFSGFDLPYIKLFGMDENPQSLMGFIRCGTFKEGNFFGLYLLLSAIISFYLKRIRTGVFLMFTIITTFSTISLVSAFIFILFIVRKKFLKKKTIISLFTLLPFVILFSVYFIQTSYFQEKIYSKIFEPSNELSISNVSKVDRVLTARIAYKQGVNNPIFGVGPYNYGLHYDRYNDFNTYIINNNSWSLEYFKRYKKRAIPNNVYMEVWAEYGIVGFVLFISFLIITLLRAFKSKNDVITGGIIALMISFNAFPSFIMLFLWVFLAIPGAINHKNKLFLND